MFGRKRLVVQGIILFVMAFLGVAAFNQNREKVQIELLDQEIYVREISGQLRQLTRDGKPKEHVLLSPSGDRVIYHAPFDPYKSPPEPPIFTVLDVKTGNTIQQIPVRWVARYVASVEWINDRFVMVRGEGHFLVLLDLKAGKQTHNLFGSDFSLSPDGAKIIFRHDFNPRYGPIPPELKSDYVLLSLAERGPASGQVKSEYDFSNFKVIYPDVLPWGEVEQKRYDDLDKRHQVKSALTWSPDSGMIAFVEAHRQKFWLVVLELRMANNDVAVSQKSFELGPAVGKIQDLSWISGKNQIKVSGDKRTWLMDLSTGTVQAMP